ncbi:MAG: CoA ester lyase [Anaerolineae bacterium]|jgi:citrate lyase beta subunit|nr:CoA ester lyase [Anaerolineae bacterium]MBT3714531.1 CoA ester lyase [Anaerolineae bacterium]MBT4312451.1 CoA ester lyase [Anaerolineae bacterium]MBT4458709.1 CoA ester lyase [Anaerolineae bacterium]MBT4842280.1 CoA ester lyase [Anaerolineae bacterium]
MKSRRALLYMPGDSRPKIEKAISLGVDCICMDMEDATAYNRKGKAREVIAKALQELGFGHAEKLIRINGFGTGFEADDLSATLIHHPDGVVIPKVEMLAQLEWLSEQIEAMELSQGWELNSIRILAGIESAKGFINLKEIATHPRLDALIFGAEDYAASIGATRSRGGLEILYARSKILLHAAANDLQAIDIVFVNFKDVVNLKIDALQGAQMGFTGKQIIHPNQVAPVQEAFSPSDKEIDYAERLLGAFEIAEAEGAGVIDFEGKMIDMPLIKSARQIIERAKAAGKI